MNAMARLSADGLDAAFTALADPTRRAILARLKKGEASVTELAEPFAMSQPAISKHLGVLERAGFISRSRDAQRRPCRLEPRRLKAVADWLGGYREFWEAAYDRLDVYLEELQAKEKRHERQEARNRHRSR
jgi:DNA-binding transcriptional ArsR family regulator